jgi:hypothetical protein
MAIRKQVLKSKPVCKVTFKIPEKVGNAATQAHVVGEFNGWSTSATPMQRSKPLGLRSHLKPDSVPFAHPAFIPFPIGHDPAKMV